MRVVGYVRESADPADTRSAFAQQEELRRYASEHGHQLVAVCQDVRAPGRAPARDGYLSVLGVVSGGGVDAVLVPGLDTLSRDSIVQEIILWDLRARGVRVVSTDPVDLTLLDDTAVPAADRLVIRDVLERVEQHRRQVGTPADEPPETGPPGDVLVRIIEADAAEQASFE